MKRQRPAPHSPVSGERATGLAAVGGRGLLQWPEIRVPRERRRGGRGSRRLRCCQGLHPFPAHPHSGRTRTDARRRRGGEKRVAARTCIRRGEAVEVIPRAGADEEEKDRH